MTLHKGEFDYKLFVQNSSIYTYMITMSFYLFILLIKNVQNICIRVQGVITVHGHGILQIL